MGRERAGVLGQMSDVDAVRVLDFAVAVGKEVEFAAAGAHFPKENNKNKEGQRDLKVEIALPFLDLLFWP